MLPVRWILFLTALLAATLFAVATPLSAEDSLRLDGTWTHQSSVERRLASRVSLSSDELSLADLAELLRQQFSINVKLDRRAFDDVGLSPQTTVSAFTLSNVVLEEALNHVLRERDLTVVVHNDTLIITTDEEAENEFDTRVYPVADLVIVGRSARAAGDPKFDDYDSLIDTITSTIAPDSWEQVGGGGSIDAVPVSRALVISQTREVQRWIAPLLETLRRAKTVSRKMVGDSFANRSTVGSRPYVPSSRAPAAAGSSRPGRYVYRPQGGWQTPTRSD